MINEIEIEEPANSGPHGSDIFVPKEKVGPFLTSPSAELERRFREAEGFGALDIEAAAPVLEAAASKLRSFMDGARLAVEGVASSALLGRAVRCCAYGAFSSTLLLGATSALAEDVSFSVEPVPSVMETLPTMPTFAFKQFAEKVLYANRGVNEDVTDFLETIDAIGAECLKGGPGAQCTFAVPGLSMDYSNARYVLTLEQRAGGFAEDREVVVQDTVDGFSIVDDLAWDYVEGIWQFDKAQPAARMD